MVRPGAIAPAGEGSGIAVCGGAVRRPLVLVGETRSSALLDVLQTVSWGRMFLTRRPTPFPFEKWGFDNGAFQAFCKGRPFPESDFRRRLDAALLVNSDPYLAVVPDIVAAGRRSLDFSLKWLAELRGVDWPWYLAVQDGMEVDEVRSVLHLFSGVFLGGSNRFKATAYRWRVLAHGCGLRFHYGRASTPAKLGSAFRVGSDSCDSAFPLWTAARMREFVARWQGLGSQKVFEW